MKRMIGSTFSPTKIKSFLLNERVALVFSAVIITPVIIRVISRFRNNIPVLGAHLPLFLLVASLIILAVANGLSGYLGAIVYGLAAGTLIAALTETSIGARIIGRIQAVA